MKKFALVVDNEHCWGCKACEVACKQEHQTPDDVKLIEVIEDGPKMVNGKMDFVYRVQRCRHCDDPPCAPACPVDAITKRDDGIVILNEDECSGCMSCIDACPYGSISFNNERGVAQKCNLCYFRVDNGLYPACADNICLAHCIYFGYADEIDETVAQKPWLKKRMQQAAESLASQMKEKGRR